LLTSKRYRWPAVVAQRPERLAQVNLDEYVFVLF
jgi:hypothetical protein